MPAWSLRFWIPVLVLTCLGVMLVTCGRDSPTGPTDPTPPSPALPFSVAVTPADTVLTAVGQTVRLTATVRDRNGNQIANPSVQWSSSDPAVGTVDQTGLVAAVKRGACTITATAGDVSGQASISVEPPSPASIAITPDAAGLTAIGQTVQFMAEVRDQYGAVIPGVAVAWSTSDTSVARVDSTGLAVATGKGMAVISAKVGEAVGRATLTVMQDVNEIVLEPVSHEMLPGDTLRITAMAFDAEGASIDDAVFLWASSDESVATVDQSGLVAAVDTGTAKVTASAGGAEASAQITVTAPPPAAIAISPEHVTFAAIGDTLRLSAMVEDAEGRALPGAAVAWSSDDETVATVSAGGLVTAEGPGRTMITALAGEVSASAEAVVAQVVEAVSVVPPALSLAVGGRFKLAAAAVDANGHPVRDAAFVWSSSDRTVADVNAAGLVTAVNSGSAIVTASHGEKAAGAEVTVLDRDEESKIERAALVALYNATNGAHWTRNRNWASDEPLGRWEGVYFDEQGRVSGLLLNLNGLRGPVPDEIGLLRHLRLLDLGANQLTGALPAALGNLTSLRNLHLHQNEFTGPLPPELGALSELEYLSLGGNRLSGPVPSFLGGMINLEIIYLNDNLFTGQLPPELGKLGRLKELTLGSNRLSGPIPRSFLGLRELKRFPITVNEGLCVPGTREFIDWTHQLGDWRNFVEICSWGDQRALLAFHEAANGRGWTNGGGWAFDPYAALEDWYGITADSLGLVTGIDLRGNGLTGFLSPRLAELTGLTSLRIDGNTLSGRIPLSLSALRLDEFHYDMTGLCVQADAAFEAWLDAITSHRGTNAVCKAATDRDILVSFYHGTGGPGWRNQDNWLTDRPIANWHGVFLDGQGRVRVLALSDNNLTGSLVPEIAKLSELESLVLSGNRLTGTIPSEFGDLSNLRFMILHKNHLSGSIPDELGNLTDLRLLMLEQNDLSGSLPAGIGRLSNLELLLLDGNNLSGPLPAEIGGLESLEELQIRDNRLSGSLPAGIGRLSNLTRLDLENNDLGGPLPAEIGGLGSLEELWIQENDLTGPLPPEIGRLTRLEVLALSDNDFRGGLPSTLGDLGALRHLYLSGNTGLTGSLPAELTGLSGLAVLAASNTGLCAGSDSAMRAWLENLDSYRVASCQTMRTDYLITQAVQSGEFPVPLVAGEDAFLRVFVTSDEVTGLDIPGVRATFFQDGAASFVADVPAQTNPIPAEVDESRLSNSANVKIPASIVEPGLEVVIEIDPGGALPPGLDMAKRIPRTGRAAVDVRTMPVLDLTLIPFLYADAPDRQVLEQTDGLNPSGLLVSAIDILLPVESMDLQVHDPVWTSVNYSGTLLGEVAAIRAMEGGTGYYMGLMSGPFDGPTGLATSPGREAFASSDPLTMAHELGHNFSLGHAPCDAPGPDPAFPESDGSIGAWGYDFRDASLVPPWHKDLMSYCGPTWISDYHFTRALRYRVERESDIPPPAAARVLLVWGGVDEFGAPFLEPAFVVDAPPVLPDAEGAYRIAGASPEGERFSFRFAMPELAHGAGRSVFAFAVPVPSEWGRELTEISLSGPGGTARLDRQTDLPMFIYRDAVTGQVRGMLRAQELDDPGISRRSILPEWVGDGDVEVHSSSGLPGRSEWEQ